MNDTGALTTIKLAWQALKVTLAHYRKAPLQLAPYCWEWCWR